MGGYSASSDNVVFPYSEALAAARAMQSLSGVVREKHRARMAKKSTAEDSWEGGHHTEFIAKMKHEDTDSGTVADGIGSLATNIAKGWSQARGEQDRINFARYVQHEKDDDGWLENSYEYFAGEDDYGAPPEDPPVPSAQNDFQPTRQPIHPEWEHRKP